jgi:capsular polysaccharide biosynthesis protein
LTTRTPGESDPGEGALSLRELLRVVRRRLWVIVLVTFVVPAAAVGFSLQQTPTYQATAQVLVGEEAQGQMIPNLSSSVTGLQDIVATVVEAIDSQRVAQQAAAETGLSPEQLLGGLSVEPVVETQFIYITYTDTDPERAQEAANAVAYAASDQMSGIGPASTTLTTEVWEEAQQPTAPSSPDVLLPGVVALVFGLALGLGLAFLLEYLDESWRSPEELERISGVPNFGIVPSFKHPRKVRKYAAGKGRVSKVRKYVAGKGGV